MLSHSSQLRGRHPPRSVLRWPALVLALIAPRTAGAQHRAAVAGSYADSFAEVMALDAVPGGVADVSGLVLQRDVAWFILWSGKLYLLTPIGGRTVAALFRGSGVFSFRARVDDRAEPAREV